MHYVRWSWLFVLGFLMWISLIFNHLYIMDENTYDIKYRPLIIVFDRCACAPVIWFFTVFTQLHTLVVTYHACTYLSNTPKELSYKFDTPYESTCKLANFAIIPDIRVFVLKILHGLFVEEIYDKKQLSDISDTEDERRGIMLSPEEIIHSRKDSVWILKIWNALVCFLSLVSCIVIRSSFTYIFGMFWKRAHPDQTISTLDILKRKPSKIPTLKMCRSSNTDIRNSNLCITDDRSYGRSVEKLYENKLAIQNYNPADQDHMYNVEITCSRLHQELRQVKDKALEDHSNLMRKYEAISLKKREISKQLSSAMKENDTIKKQIELNTVQKNSLSRKVELLKKDFKEATKSRQQMLKQIETIMSDNNNYKKTNELLEKENELLKRQLEEARKELNFKKDSKNCLESFKCNEKPERLSDVTVWQKSIVEESKLDENQHVVPERDENVVDIFQKKLLNLEKSLENLEKRKSSEHKSVSEEKNYDEVLEETVKLEMAAKQQLRVLSDQFTEMYQSCYEPQVSESNLLQQKLSEESEEATLKLEEEQLKARIEEISAKDPIYMTTSELDLYLEYMENHKDSNSSLDNLVKSSERIFHDLITETQMAKLIDSYKRQKRKNMNAFGSKDDHELIEMLKQFSTEDCDSTCYAKSASDITATTNSSSNISSAYYEDSEPGACMEFRPVTGSPEFKKFIRGLGMNIPTTSSSSRHLDNSYYS